MGNRYTKSTTVLAKAIMVGDEVMVLVALALGGDPRTPAWNHEVHESISMLSMAVMKGHAHLVPHLVAAGAPVDGLDEVIKPLHGAAGRGDARVMRALLTAGANTEVTSHDGTTVLHVAAAKGEICCFELLLSAKANVNAEDNRKRRPLHHAALHDHIGVVELLLDVGHCDRHALDEDRNTALHLAALKGGLGAVQCLVSAGLDPMAKNTAGHTALDLARCGSHHLVEWWLRKQPRLSHVADTPTVDLVRHYWKDLTTTLQDAFRVIREEDSIRYTHNLSETVSPYQQDSCGRTLLHWAADLGKGVVVAHILDNYQLYPRLLTWDLETPADLARRAGHHQVLHALQQYQLSDITKVEGSQEELYGHLLSVITLGDDDKQVRNLLSSGAPLESPGGCSTQPLPLAITSNRFNIVNLLLAAGAPLTTTCQGLNLVALAWRSPDVTPPVQAAVTGAFFHVLQYEREKLSTFPELVEGVSQLLSTIRFETPWRARWPTGGSVVHLTQLMVHAARARCSVTCSFLHEAGGQSSLCEETGVSPLHAALEAGHWHLARQMLKNMGGCLYVPDCRGQLPTTMMPSHLRQQLEQNIYNKERDHLEDLQVKLRDKAGKQEVQELLDLQEVLFTSYLTKIPGTRGNTDTLLMSQERFDKAQALLTASRDGLLQLIYLLVTEGGVEVDTEVDPTCGATALHQAASHGKSGSVLLLLSLGAKSLKEDLYKQTPPHMAAMFCHQKTYELFSQVVNERAPFCRAGTTPADVKNNFSKYLRMYYKSEADPTMDFPIENNQKDATMNLLKRIDMERIVKKAQAITVDYSKGEAREVKEAVIRELKVITEKVAAIDSTYTGTLTLLGSTADATRLYCPDEYDFNLILSGFSDVSVKVLRQTKREVLLSGHKLKVEVKSNSPSLQGNHLMSHLYDRVKEVLSSYVLQDDRLSLVPPGVTRTQVGVSLSLAWQGSEYSLLLVDIDLVPVLPVPWPKEISRPFLTPDGSQVIHLSNTVDAKWRGSFAATEVEVVKQLGPQERKVFLTGKTLLSCMKAELWMPRDLKNQLSWWDSRYWKIPIPAGFCFKNSFLMMLHKKSQEGAQWREQDTVRDTRDVFKGMCLEMEGTERLVPAKVHAYFGGDCEKPKVGEGAPEISEFLDNPSNPLYPEFGYLGFKHGFLNRCPASSSDKVVLARITQT